MLADSNFIPASSTITVPPVRTAISASISFLLSPNPGAFTAAHLRVPRILLTTRVAKASPSISSANISTGLEVLATSSKRGTKSFILAIFFSYININGSSNSIVIRSGSVTK